MTSSAFWFCISAMYFPFVSNEIIDRRTGIYDILQRILERNINAQRNFSIKHKQRKKKIMLDLVSLIDTNYIKRNEELMVNCIESNIPKKQIGIENLINTVSDRIDSVHKINQDRITNQLVEVMNKSRTAQIEANGSLDSSNHFNFSQSLNNFKILTDNLNENFNSREYDRDDILIDMQFKSKFKKQFEEYIIRKHEEISENQKEVILSRSDEEKNHNPDDIVCLVCNDGDYEDNNLIVYCSKCQMTVHQQCYGIVTIPEEDWLCYPCQFYDDDDEKAKQIECVLCPIKGGAMKPSCLKIKSSFWNNVMSLRRDNYKNNYCSTSSLNGFLGSNSMPNLNECKEIEEIKIKSDENKVINEKKDINGELKDEIKMDLTNSPKIYSASQKIPLYNQDSMLKNFSNRTITESNEDNLSVKYFNQDANEKNSMDVEYEKKYEPAIEIKSEKDNQNLNKSENMPNSLLDDNLENIVSTNDPNLNSYKNQLSNSKRQNNKNYGENADIESDSSKEILEKTNAEILSNESINERNNKLNIDLNLNLNENDNLSLNNDFLNNKNAQNFNESIKLEDEKSNNTNLKNKISMANRRRGRQKKNIRNKKDDGKVKEDLNNPSKQAAEFISTISRKIFSENAWVHLSCALWIPEVLIEDFEKKENIKNIENIEKKRFNETCSICNWGGCGPTIKCENADCKVRFHVECARINKFQMEFIDNSNGEYKYYIFCRLHQPHRMIKNIELKRQNEINDIKAFRSIILRCFEILDINENITYSNYTPSKSIKHKLANCELSNDEENNRIRHRKSKLKLEITPKDKKDILNQIRNVALDVVSGYCLVFKKQTLKKDLKISSENPCNQQIINEEINKEEDEIKEPENFDKLEYKLIALDDSKEMQIDDGNAQKVLFNREIEINNDKKESLQNIHENLLSYPEEKMENINISNVQLKETNIDNEFEIPAIDENCEWKNDSLNQSRPYEVENEDKLDHLEEKGEENQMKIEKDEPEKHSNQAEILKHNKEFEVGSDIILELNGNKVDMNMDENYYQINASDVYQEMKYQEKKNIKSLENFQNNFVFKSEEQFNETDIKNEAPKISDNSAKIREKKQSKEYTYKIQNYRNVKRDPLIVSNHLSYNDTLNPRLFPWFYIKFGNKKPIEIVNLYKRWIKDEEAYRKDILKSQNIPSVQVYQEPQNTNNKGKKKKLGSRNTNFAINNQFTASNSMDNVQENTEILNVKAAEEAVANQPLYCYCKDPNNPDTMTACNNEPNCPNKGWIHVLCDEELRNLSLEEIQRQDFEFLCKDCRKMSKLKTRSNKGKRKSKKK